MNEQELHAYANEVVEVVIAYSPEDAIKVMEEMGADYSVDGDDDGFIFKKLRDDQEYTLYEEELINPEPVPEGAVLVERGEYSHTYRAPLSAWIKARGRCFLGSTEY